MKLRKRLGLVAGALGLAASSILIGGGSASADDTVNYLYTLQRHGTSLCLDVSYARTDAGAPVIQWTCNGQNNQAWYGYGNGTDPYAGYVELVNANSHMCLDVPYGSTTWGTKLQQWPCNGGRNQMWWHGYDQYGHAGWINQATGQMIDVPGGSTTPGVQVEEWPGNDGGNQHFDWNYTGRTQNP